MVQLSKDEIIKITQRLQNVRQGLVQKTPFYAILLFGLRFSLDDMVERVYTDGERIAFNPDFLREISDKELEFIMLHEVSHVALGHPFRCVHDYDIEIFDEACDIVVNSNIFHYMGDDESFITIKGLGTMPHKNYDNEEGYRFTVEQVYEHLFRIKGRKKRDDGIISDFGLFDEEDFDEVDELETIEEVDEDDDLDAEDSEDGDNEAGKGMADEKKKSSKKSKKNSQESEDFASEENDGEEDESEGDDSEGIEEEQDSSECESGEKGGKDGKKGKNNKKRISKKGKDGLENEDDSLCEEDENEELESEEDSDDSNEGQDGASGKDSNKGSNGKKEANKGNNAKKGGKGNSSQGKANSKCLSQNGTNSNQMGGACSFSQSNSNLKGKGGVVGKGYKKALESLNSSQIKSSNASPVIRFDDHSFWKNEDKQNISKATWESRVLQTYETIKNAKLNLNANGGKGCGNTPCFAERLYEEITERKLDWKTLLNDFIQEDVCDYSFSPPDRRFGDSDFFLPDFNEKEETVENLLFMIDTSGSMSDFQISEVYSEIKGAIEQFNGRIKGWLGFFDAIVTEPKEFNDEEEFKAIRIQGGGGTAFLPIFHYVRDHMKDKNITSIIILTDGYAPYPEEYERMDIPVLWIINNENATPPWGMIARISQKNNQEII